MVFSSVTFLFLFLPVVLLGYFALPNRARNGFLLAASLLFYAWGEPLFVVVMLLSITANHFFGLRVANPGRPAARRWMALAVVFNLGMLVLLKYANFIVDNSNALARAFGWPELPWTRIPLPIGISFFTFQAMSYVIDVYRGQVAAQRSWSALALYISLFPQLIAGPIVRYADIAKEIVNRTVTRAGFAAGVRDFLIGLGKKALIANVLAEKADAIFGLSPAALPPGVAWLGLFCYTMQLYFDFSGYSDMAIGLGRMFGFNFLPNFNYPYISRTITELWRRWHISLSTWLRDYLYIPLGGNRAGPARTYRNLAIVFLLCGFWHGASWNFVLWGLYQGVFLIAERLGRATERPFFRSFAGLAYANLAFALSLVMFRCETLAQSAGYYRALVGAVAPPPGHTVSEFVTPQMLLAAFAAVIGSGPLIPALLRALDRRSEQAWAIWARHAGGLLALAFILAACSLKIASGTHNPFIYFRF
jgi:alginate O-acetyltransferase complex protein AlgI